MTNNDVLSEDMETMRQIAAACLADMKRASGPEARQAVLGEHARNAHRAADGRRARLQAMQAAHEQDAAGAATPETRQTAACAAELCRLAIPMASDGSGRIRSGFRRE